jgi:hypothetical protein
VAHAAASQPSWQGSLRDLPVILQTIRRSRAFGRLTLRNAVRLGVAHLYFHHGELAHIVGTRGDALATLDDMRGWSQATVRFERGIIAIDATIGGNSEYERMLEDVVAQLQARGVINQPQSAPRHRLRVVESHLVTDEASEAEQLIAPLEWNLVVEGTRRVSLAVAHLVGPSEAMSALRDILDDCIAGFPALEGLQIAPGGYVQVTERALLDRVPRAELLEGFAALFLICQHFCAPIIGDEDAHRLMLQALGDIGPALVGLGVFSLANHVLPGGQMGSNLYRG